MDKICIGKFGAAITKLHVYKSYISLRSLGASDSLVEKNGRFRVMVDIINTTVDVDVLHKVNY